MDSLACNVIYVNRLVDGDRLVRAIPDDSVTSSTGTPLDWDSDRVRVLVQPLLDAFGDGWSPPPLLNSQPYLLTSANLSCSPCVR